MESPRTIHPAQAIEGDRAESRGVTNPMPLGMAALAITVAMFGTYNAGQLHVGSMMMASMMILFGGVVALVSAILAYTSRDVVGMTVFGSFCAFWAALGVIFFANDLGHTVVPTQTGDAFTWFWFFWAIMSSYLWVGSLRTNGALSTFVGLMAAMLWCLWLGELTLGRPGTGWTQAAGFVGWGAALVGAYVSFAELVNQTMGRILLPEFGPVTMKHVSSAATGR